MRNRVVKFARVNLGDTNGDGTDTILDYALGGADVVMNKPTRTISIRVPLDTTSGHKFTISSAALAKSLVIENSGSNNFTDSTEITVAVITSLSSEIKNSIIASQALSYFSKQSSTSDIRWEYNSDTSLIVGTYQGPEITFTVTNSTGATAWVAGLAVTTGSTTDSFKAGGPLLGIGDISNSLLFEKTNVPLTFISTDVELMSKFNSFKYLNKPVSIWVGTRNTDGTIADVSEVFRGYCDRHSVDDKNIILHAQSIWSRFEQPRGATNNSSEQQAIIEAGKFGVSPTTSDDGFEFVDVDYSSLTFGKNDTIFEDGKNVKTVGSNPYIEVVPGKQIVSSFSPRALAVGRSAVKAQLIHSFNVDPTTLKSVYTDFAGGFGLDTSSASYKTYLARVYAVCEGPVDEISVSFPDADLEHSSVVSGLSFYGINSANSPRNAINYDNGGGNTSSIAMIDVANGEYDQSALSRITSIDPDSDWTSNHRCLGTTLVAVIVGSSHIFDYDIPEVVFTTTGKRVRSIIKSSDDYYLSTLGTSARLDTPNETASYDLVSASGNSSARDFSVGQSATRVILDIILDEAYGLGTNIADVDLKSFYDAQQNEADTSAQSGSYAANCRGVIEQATSLRETVKSLLDISKANISWINGKITMVPNRYLGTDAATKLASTTFNESNIIDGLKRVEYAPWGSATIYNQYNTSAPVINDITVNDYQLINKNNDFYAEDSKKKSELKLNLPLAGIFLDENGDPSANSKEVVEDIALARVRASRLFTTGSFDLDYWTNKELKVGDVFELSNKRFNFVGDNTKLAKVTKLTFKKLGVVSVNWREYSNSIHHTLVASALKQLSSINFTGSSISVETTPATNRVVRLSATGTDSGSEQSFLINDSLEGDFVTIPANSTAAEIITIFRNSILSSIFSPKWTAGPLVTSGTTSHVDVTLNEAGASTLTFDVPLSFPPGTDMSYATSIEQNGSDATTAAYYTVTVIGGGLDGSVVYNGTSTKTKAQIISELGTLITANATASLYTDTDDINITADSTGAYPVLTIILEYNAGTLAATATTVQLGT